MRIVLSFPACHRRGGVERIVLECANYLQTHGHQVHLLATEWDASELAAGIQCHQVPAGRWSWRRISEFSRNSRTILAALPQAPDVIAAFGVEAPPGAVVWVQSVHKAWMEVSQRHRSLKGRWRQRLNPFHAAAARLEESCFGARSYRRLIALTDTVKADLIRLYNVPPADIDLLPNGFSAIEFNVDTIMPNRQSLRQSLRYRDNDKVILFVANELERKGFSTLIRALASMKDVSLKLLVIGRVSPDEYRTEVEQLGLAQQVQFTGPRGDVARYYAAADLFVLPTQYEAWGLVIVEALACGLRVVTSRLAGASVAVSEGQTGYLLEDPRDPAELAGKIRRILEEPESDRHTIASSVSQYSWDRILPRYERLLVESNHS
jgi:UDP-glucose:(heptosyl)LPS alpha-1,3-glucosyltransferase